MRCGERMTSRISLSPGEYLVRPGGVCVCDERGPSLVTFEVTLALRATLSVPPWPEHIVAGRKGPFGPMSHKFGKADNRLRNKACLDESCRGR